MKNNALKEQNCSNKDCKCNLTTQDLQSSSPALSGSTERRVDSGTGNLVGWELENRFNQKNPIINGNPRVVDLVIADLLGRSEVGFKKYGTHLQSFNGRNALWDAYCEALDMAQYLKQRLIEEGFTLPEEGVVIDLDNVE